MRAKGRRPFPRPVELDGTPDVNGIDRPTISLGNDAQLVTSQTLPLGAVSKLLTNRRLERNIGLIRLRFYVWSCRIIHF